MWTARPENVFRKESDLNSICMQFEPFSSVNSQKTDEIGFWQKNKTKTQTFSCGNYFVKTENLKVCVQTVSQSRFKLDGCFVV